MVAPLFEFTGIDHCKPFCSLVEPYDEVVEHGCRFAVSGAFQRGYKTTSVMEDIYVELELVVFQMGFDTLGQTRGCLVSAFLSFCDQLGEKDRPISIDQHNNPFVASLDCLNGRDGRISTHQQVVVHQIELWQDT